MELHTVRLLLRPLTQNDFDELCEILQDPITMQAYEGAFTVQEVQCWLDNQLLRYSETKLGLLAVIHLDTGEFLGQAGITLQECNHKTVHEIGYLFKRKHWHNGYATEAALALKEHAFNVLNQQAIYSIVRDTNEASKRVALRAGMRPVHAVVKHYRGVTMPHTAFMASKPKTEE